MNIAQFLLWVTLRAEDAGFSETPRFSRDGDRVIAKIGNLTMSARFVEGFSESATASTPGFAAREFNLVGALS